MTWVVILTKPQIEILNILFFYILEIINISGVDQSGVNAAIRLLTGVGAAALLVIGLAVVGAYEIAVADASSGDIETFRQLVAVGVLAVLAIAILSVATRIQ